MNRIISIAFVMMVCGCVSMFETSAPAAGRQLFKFEAEGRFGFKDEAGRVVIQPVWDDAGEFAFGRCPVNQGASVDFTFFPVRRHGGKWGYINAQGRLVVPLTLDWAEPFAEGIAQVSDAQGRRFIDVRGKTVFALEPHVSAGCLSEGLIPVYVDRSLQNQDWQTRFINPKGESVFTVDGYASEFHEGMSVVIVRDSPDGKQSRSGFVNSDGEIVIVPQFSEAQDFSEGLAGVRTTKTTGWYGKGDTWGYIDQTGKMVLPPVYNEVQPFSNGVARVHVGGTLKEYAVHAPPAWEGGEWQLINRKGEVVGQP